MTSLSRRTMLSPASLPRRLARAVPLAAAAAGDMRIAFGDLPGIESIQTLAAIERAKERGVEIELIILNDEDLAAQAIVGGQADVGIGAPYTLIQKVGVPIRILRADRDAALLPGRQHRVLQGAGRISTARSRGAGARLRHRGGHDADGQEQRHHLFGNISYVPGSEVRRGALMQGTIKASIVDAANRRILEAGRRRQVHGAAGRGPERHRRSALRHHRLSRARSRRRSISWSRN